MSGVPHVMERYAERLAGKLSSHIDMLSDFIAPPGQRLPFTQQLSKRAALDFWKQHRYDEIGKPWLDRMDAQSVMELDNALSRANEAILLQGDD